MSETDHTSIHQRRTEMLRIIADAGYVTTAELCRRLFISEPTVRRELSALEAEGLIRRCRGGALALSGGIRQPMAYRKTSHQAEKRRIARKAASLIADGDVLFIDTSTTAMCLLEHIRTRQGLTIITNSLPVLELAASLSMPTNPIACKCTGGDMHLESMGLVGHTAERFIAGIRADKFFFSTPCLSQNGRISDYSEAETYLRAAMLDNARTSVFLCDSSKFGTEATFTLSHLCRMNYVISDAPLPADVPLGDAEFLLS